MSRGCKPGFYRSAADSTTCPPCVDLYPDGSVGRVHPRVRDYANNTRPPAWLSHNCGHDGVTIPGAASLFLRNTARYVYSLSAAAVCGDAILQVSPQLCLTCGHIQLASILSFRPFMTHPTPVHSPA